MTERRREPFDGGDALGASGAGHNEVGGAVIGPSVQARDVHGGVHIHSGTALPPPSQLPDAGPLVDREHALAELDSLLPTPRSRPARVVLISGPPGVGKSALALAWAHRVVGSFPDGQLYTALSEPEGTPAGTVEVLGRFIRALGIPPERVPGDLAECSALYRSLMAHRRIVVVLDDAVSAGQVNPLLPGSAGSLCVVTSRWRLMGLLARGAHGLQLDRLDHPATLELLRRLIGADRTAAEPKAADRLAELCAHLPLAVCIAGARLATRPNWRISEMVEALSHERRRLTALSVEDDMALRAALDLSYRALPDPAARLYRLLGLYPGTSFTSRVAAAGAALPLDETSRLLGVLADANLLDDAPGGRYRFHGLIHLHARELAEGHETNKARAETVRRILDWFLVSVTAAGRLAMPYRNEGPRDIAYPPADPMEFDAGPQALNWLDEEFPNLRAAVRCAYDSGLFATAWQLADAMWPLFLYRGHYGERLDLDLLALTAARRCGDRRGAAKMLNRAGLALRQLGRLDEAAGMFEEALGEWERLGDTYRVAGTWRRLGLVASDSGSYEAATDHFGAALRTYRSLGAGRKVALTDVDLGTVLIEVGRPGEAITHLDAAREALQAGADHYNLARARMLAGLARARLGEPARADEELRAALDLMRRIPSPPGEAAVLESMGVAAAERGEVAEAQQRYREAFALLTRLNSVDADRLRDRLTW